MSFLFHRSLERKNVQLNEVLHRIIVNFLPFLSGGRGGEGALLRDTQDRVPHGTHLDIELNRIHVRIVLLFIPTFNYRQIRLKSEDGISFNF